MSNKNILYAVSSHLSYYITVIKKVKAMRLTTNIQRLFKFW